MKALLRLFTVQPQGWYKEEESCGLKIIKFALTAFVWGGIALALIAEVS